jgi:hypothetical protein
MAKSPKHLNHFVGFALALFRGQAAHVVLDVDLLLVAPGLPVQPLHVEAPRFDPQLASQDQLFVDDRFAIGGLAPVVEPSSAMSRICSPKAQSPRTALRDIDPPENGIGRTSRPFSTSMSEQHARPGLANPALGISRAFILLPQYPPSSSPRSLN